VLILAGDLKYSALWQKMIVSPDGDGGSLAAGPL
jgi:hypothetical protein